MFTNENGNEPLGTYFSPWYDEKLVAGINHPEKTDKTEIFAELRKGMEFIVNNHLCSKLALAIW